MLLVGNRASMKSWPRTVRVGPQQPRGSGAPGKINESGVFCRAPGGRRKGGGPNSHRHSPPNGARPSPRGVRGPGPGESWGPVPTVVIDGSGPAGRAVFAEPIGCAGAAGIFPQLKLTPGRYLSGEPADGRPR